MVQRRTRCTFIVVLDYLSFRQVHRLCSDMVIGNSSLRSCPLEAGEAVLERAGSVIVYRTRNTQMRMKMNINYSRRLKTDWWKHRISVRAREAALHRDRLNDFAIPFRRGRVETGSKWYFIQHETHLHTLVII